MRPRAHTPRRALCGALISLVALPATGCELPRGHLDFTDPSSRITLRAPPPAPLFGDRLAEESRAAVARVRGEDVRRLLPARPHDLATGATVFAALPVADTWTHLAWQAARVRAAGAAGIDVVTEEGRTFERVPPALVTPTGPRPARGAIVRVAAGRDAPYGVIESVAPRTFTARTAWLGRIRRVEARPEEVLSLPDPLAPGAPVVFGPRSDRRLGSVITADGKHRWVMGPEGILQRVIFTEVRPLALRLDLRVGDAVIAPQPIRLTLATVVGVLEDGLRYEIAREQTDREVVTFDRLAPP